MAVEAAMAYLFLELLMLVVVVLEVRAAVLHGLEELAAEETEAM
jgi:hypothetical protein